MKIRPLAFSLAAALGIASFSVAAPARAESVLDTIVPLVDSIAGQSTSGPLDDLATQLGAPTLGNIGSYAPIDVIPTYGNVEDYPVDPQYVVGEDDENDGEQNDEFGPHATGGYDNGAYVNGPYPNGTSNNRPYDNGVYNDSSQQNNDGQNGDGESGDAGHDD